MPIKYIKDLQELKNHLETGKNTVLMASATYCMPCKRFTPVVEEVSDEMADSVVFLKVNLDENPSVNDFLGVGSVPTLIYWKGSSEAYRTIGMSSKEELIKKIKQIFV